MAVDRPRLVTDVMGGMGDRADTLGAADVMGLREDGSSAPCRTTRPRAAKALKSRRLAESQRQVASAGLEIDLPRGDPDDDEGREPGRLGETRPVRGAVVAIVRDQASGSSALAPAISSLNVCQGPNFTAAVVDMNIGLDPDLYPLLASRQAGIGGSNLSGVQSLVLDELLVAARKPGSLAERRGAWAKLEQFLSRSQVMLPSPSGTTPGRARDRVVGPHPRARRPQ